MLKYLAKRIFRSLITLFIVITIVFSLLRLMPVEGYFDNFDKMSEEQLERELENRDKEIYGLKHDLIDAKLEQEKLTKRIHELETELAEEQKMKARLSQSAAGRKIHRPEQKL